MILANTENEYGYYDERAKNFLNVTARMSQGTFYTHHTCIKQECITLNSDWSRPGQSRELVSN